MVEDEPRHDGPTLRLKQLRCRRLDRLVDLEEHESCPYCFGQREDMASGRYEAFCDWQAGRDPIRFGFPPDVRRDVFG